MKLLQLLREARWIHGAPDCSTSAEPPLQVYAVDTDTFILRQSKCSSFEAPFIYLLFGRTTAFLLDTGAPPDRGGLPLRQVVDGIVAERLVRRGETAPELVVAHSHGDGDHVFGDGQFRERDRTTVVPPDPMSVRQFFGLRIWPEQLASLDLGRRELTIIPVPGHDPSHIAVYDSTTGIVFSGDTFYPGFLYVQDWTAFRHSIDRLVRFMDRNPVSCFLGAHIEMTDDPGIPYPPGTTYQPKEHSLELFPRHLTTLRAQLEMLGDHPTRCVCHDFIIEPIGGTDSA